MALFLSLKVRELNEDEKKEIETYQNIVKGKKTSIYDDEEE